MINCSSCGSIDLKEESNIALTSWEKENDGSITSTPGNFIPVKALYCGSCGHVDLFVDPQ